MQSTKLQFRYLIETQTIYIFFTEGDCELKYPLQARIEFDIFDSDILI